MPRPPIAATCCSCSPRAARPRPRPRPSNSTNPSSSSPSSSNGSIPSSPSLLLHHHPFTTSCPSSATHLEDTASTTRTTSTTPTLDFLYPGFGFFSRSLPPLVSSSSSSPSSPSTSLPPTSPQLEPRLFDLRNWRTRETLSSNRAPPPSHNGLLSPSPAIRTTTTTNWNRSRIGLGKCVCGRTMESCLRCRGKSTDSRSSTIPFPAPERVDLTESMVVVDKGKGKAVDTMRDEELMTPSPRFTKSTVSPTPSSPKPPSSRKPTPSPPSSSLASLRKFIAQLDSSLPSSRGSSILLPTPSSLTTTSQHLHHSRKVRKRTKLFLHRPTSDKSQSSKPATSLTSLDRMSHLLDTLFQSLSSSENDRFWNEMRYYEKLDAVRLLSRIVKTPLPDDGDNTVGPLVLVRRHNEDEGKEEDFGNEEREKKRNDLRKRAGSYMSDLLGRIRKESRLKGEKRSELSEAGLALEAMALKGLAGEVPSRRGNEEESSEGEEYSKAIKTVFGRDWEIIKDVKEKNKVIQAVRSGVANLFEAWSREGGTQSGQRSFHLIFEYDLERLFRTTIESNSEWKKRQERGYNDLLLRQYGLLLAQLSPSPSEWLEERSIVDSQEYFRIGSHLIEHLARAGSAGEARKVWESLVRRRQDDSIDDLNVADKFTEDDSDRCRTLTTLIDGLIMERFYQDANLLASELEPLAKSLERTNRTLALESYRILAKLASNQGRPPILSRLLTRIESLESSSSSSSTPPSLESFARQLRAKSAQYDLKSVKTLFSTFETSSEFAKASQEDRSRLRSQYVLAHTRVNDVEGAVRALQAMVHSGLRPPLSAINAILYGYARRGDVLTVDTLFQQLVEGDFARVKPDVGSWNALVLARTTVRDPSAAVRVIQEMQQSTEEGLSKVTPNRQTWTTLMAGLVDNGEWRQAFNVYRFLEEHPSIEFRPDTAATNVVLKACVLTATPASSVLSLFRQLLVRGFRPNMMTYTLVLQSLTTAGLMDLAEELYVLMDRPPTFSSSRTSTSTNEDPAFPPSSTLPTSMTPVRPDQFIFSTLIAGYLKHNEKAKARACLAEMRRRGIEPSSITLAIIVGSRLNERSTPTRVKQMVFEARKLLKGEDTAGAGLTTSRRTQSTRNDRRLAMGDEAVAIFAPIFRSAAKQGLASSALELIEEVQSRRSRSVEVPIELYTMLMDAFRRLDDPNAAADNVKIVWNRVYESVAARFIPLPEPSPSSPPLPEFLTAHFLTDTNLDLRVDPRQASILCVPFTILLDSLARAERHQQLSSICRSLARQGFAFDSSNWNTLATYYARDLQLERAFWIAENILCRPHDDKITPIPSPDAFEADFANVRRADAVARTPSRLSIWRETERHAQRKNPVDFETILSPSTSASTATTDALNSTASSSSPSSKPVDFTQTFETAHRIRQATFWHPYGSLLETLEKALQTMTLTGDAKVMEGTEKKEKLSSIEVRDRFVRDHPRTMEAIEMWKTRGERREREKERYKAGRVLL